MKIRLTVLLSILMAANVKAQNNKPIHAFSLEECVAYAQKNNVQLLPTRQIDYRW